MVIPIVQRKRSKRRKLLVITALFMIVLGLILAWNKELISAMGYVWLEWFTLGFIVIYAGLVVNFIISRKEIAIGLLRLQADRIEVIIRGENYHYRSEDLDKIQIVIEGFKGKPVKNGRSKHDGMGNLIILRAPGRTHIYEFFLKSAIDMNELLHFFRNLSPEKTQIIHNARNIV